MSSSFYSYVLNQPIAAQATFFIGGSFAIASFLAKDILLLRLLFVCATICFIATGVLILSPVMVLINFLHSSINSVQIVRILIERYSLSIPEELREVYNAVFSLMKPKEFLALIKLGKKVTYKKDTTDFIFRQGESKDLLILILSGEVSIEKNKSVIAKLGKNSFIGEMHYLTKKPMTADVIPLDDVHCVYWRHDQIDRLKLKNPHRYANILTILGQDLINKVLNTSLVKVES